MVEQEIVLAEFSNGESDVIERIRDAAANIEKAALDYWDIDEDDIKACLKKYGLPIAENGSFSESVVSIVESRDPLGDGLPEAVTNLGSAALALGAGEGSEMRMGGITQILHIGVGEESSDTVSDYFAVAKDKVFGDRKGEPGWKGESAEAFNDFADRFVARGSALIRQWWVIYTMLAGVQAIQEVRACARRDVSNLLQQGELALEGDRDGHTSDGVESVISTAGAVITFETKIGWTDSEWTVAASYTNTHNQVSDAQTTEPKTVIVAASSAPNTLETVAQYLSDIKSALDDGEKRAIKAMNDAADEARTRRNDFTGGSLQGPDHTGALTEDGELDDSYGQGWYS